MEGIESKGSDTSRDVKNDRVVIVPQSRFDFGTHKQFRTCYKDNKKVSQQYVVDMREVVYMDSSAMGMLLLLREHAIANKGGVEIVNCKPEVKKILAIANFDRLFNIR